MALSPLSPSSFARSSALATPSSAPVSSQPRGVPGLQGPQAGSALKRLLMSDGFDAPAGTGKAGMGKAGGLESTVKMLTQMTELLAKSARMLASELGAGMPAPAKGAMPAPGAPSSPTVSGPEGVSGAKGSQKGERTMTFTNDGTSPMTVQFTPNAGEQAVASRTLKTGETQTVAFPDGWSGNFRSTAGDGKAATLGEVKFNGGGNQTYYDVSYIEGANAAMTIQPESGGRKSGTMEDLLSSAPDSIKAKDGSGQTYGIKKTTTSNVQDGEVVDYYRKHVGADQGYVIPTDDASTLGSGDSHLVVHMKDLK